MNDLEDEERKLLESIERREWISVGSEGRLSQLQSYAKASLAKDKRISLRLSSLDLEALQTRAIEEGIPYQTLITSILHKYVTGRLTERRD